MKRTISRVVFVGALAALGLVACGGGGGQQLDENSPAAKAFIYRSSLMNVMGHQMEVLVGMTRGQIPVDQDKFKMAANDLQTLTTMVPDAFMAMGIPKMSRAMPAIWQNMADFKMKAQALQDAAKGVVDSAQSGGVDGSKGTVQQLGRTCGDCHRVYRKPEND